MAAAVTATLSVRLTSWTVPCLLTAAVAVSAFDYGVRREQAIQEVAFSTHRAIVDHTAVSPHRYRILVPLVLQPAIAVTGRRMTPELAFRRVYDVYYLVAFACMLLALRSYLRSWFTEEQALIGALFVAATLPIALRNNYFEPASFLEPSLLALALLWTSRGRMWRVVPLTVVASFVRETAVFIPIACWLAAGSSADLRSRRTIVMASALALSALVFAGLRWTLGAAPHISFASVWQINSSREGAFAAIVNITLFLGGAGWLLAGVGYRRAPRFVQHAMRFSPLYVASIAVWAVWYEVRLLMTLYPVLIPCVLAAMFPRPENRPVESLVSVTQVNETAAVVTSGRWLLRLGLLLAVTAAALVAGEVITRAIDGYRLTSFRLESSREASKVVDARDSQSQKWRGDLDALPYVQHLPVASGVDRDWFATQFPDRPMPKPDADLAARTAKYQPADDMRANYEWNARFVAGPVCGENGAASAASFNQFADVFLFDPVDGEPLPTYRFLANASYPSGLQTNRFGWRGRDISLTKPPRTVRIAFVGASTTVGYHSYPYSYPELVGMWLNQWAVARHPGIRFEAINAGREGVNSRSIQAIVRQELLPVDPDLVVYYEGSNQFWPADFISITLPPRPRVSVPQPGRAASFLAVARRFDTVVRHVTVPGNEPHKPNIPVNWPGDLDEHDPNLAHPSLPIQLPRIQADLDLARHALEGNGGRLALTSFVWLVYPGLALDPVRDAMLYDYLNIKYWPFTYAHMRRYLDFQNQVFLKYARVHSLDFIDIARAFPPDPRLFEDGIHMTRAGVRLQAWITFNGLVPIIQEQLASHKWPQANRHTLTEHPAFSEGRRLVQVSAIKASCTSASQPPATD
jgi:hypothetical protein